MHRAFTDPRTGLNTSARTEHQQRTHSDALARTAQNEHTSIRQALAAPVLMSLTICLLIPVVLPIVLAQALVQNILIAYLLLSTAACLVAALCLLAVRDTTVLEQGPRLRWRIFALLLGQIGGLGVLVVVLRLYSGA